MANNFLFLALAMMRNEVAYDSDRNVKPKPDVKKKVTA